MSLFSLVCMCCFVFETELHEALAGLKLAIGPRMTLSPLVLLPLPPLPHLAISLFLKGH